MSYIKNYFWDELQDDESSMREPDFYHDEYDIIEPALTNEPINDLPF